MEDTCIMCGGYVPEGAMVCPQCRIKILTQSLSPAPPDRPLPLPSDRPACVYFPISGTN